MGIHLIQDMQSWTDIFVTNRLRRRGNRGKTNEKYKEKDFSNSVTCGDGIF